MKIVIPTYKRPEGKLDVLENGWIPESFYKRVYVCIRNTQEEKERYAHLEGKVNIVPFNLADDSGIPEKREAICKHFAGEKIWMMDDDIKIVSCHTVPEKDYVIKEKELSEESFYELINYSIELLEDMPFGVIGTGTFVKGVDIYPLGLNRWGAFSSFINLEKLNPSPPPSSEMAKIHFPAFSNTVTSISKPFKIDPPEIPVLDISRKVNAKFST